MTATSDSSVQGQEPLPTSSAASVLAIAAGWPITVGIISLCYGLLALLLRLLLLAFTIMLALSPEPKGAAAELVNGRGILVDCVGVCASAALLTGGILLICRRPAARLVHLAWAAVAILMVGETAVHGIISLATGGPSESGPGDIVLLAVVGTVLRCVYPGFVLVWFLRPKIREQVKTLKHAPSSAPVAFTPAPATTVPSAPTPAASMPTSLLFRQNRRYSVRLLDAGLFARLDKESLEIPWESVARLDFDQAVCGDLTAGLVRLTDLSGRTLAWTDSTLFCTPSGALSHSHIMQIARNCGPLRPAGADGGDTLFLPGSLALTAAVIEKAGLAEQPDGAFVRMAPPEGAAPYPAIEHPSPEARVPGIDMTSRRLKQALLLVAGFIAFSFMSSTTIAASLVVFLLFHEYGHAVAMKRCGVRVDGIFILPFMGAVAVAKDEPGTRWKEFIIAIMGSIFGAALTLAVFIAALATRGAYPVLTDTTEWWTILSLFNLLPLGMLDGGRIMTSIAFSTHRVLGTIASVLAIVLCVVAAIVLRSWLLGLVAVFTIRQMCAASNAYKRSAALLGVGCTAGGLRRGIAATWQRIGIISEGDATQAQKARLAVRTLESFRRFFTGLFEIPRMPPGQIVAAVAIYAATMGLFLVLLVSAVFLGFSVKPA